MNNYKCTGERMDVVAPSGGITSGDVVLVGVKLGVAVNSAVEGSIAVIQTEGVFELPKATGAIAQGAKVYWDESAKNVTTTATDNIYMGYAYQPAASGDATVQVTLVDNPA